MSNASLKALDTHFEFGENWVDYLANVDDQAIAQAERGLQKLVPADRIAGSRFLDIGCGSGLHSLAAARLGAKEVVSVDIDPNSVRATQALLNKHAPSAPAEVKVLSVFEADPAELGTFDIVYSWGVLHHTGAMWEAIERATRFVKPGGSFVLALYQRRASCGFWRAEKRVYTRAPELVRKGIRGIYKSAFFAALLATRRNPVRYVRDYKRTRGMNFHNDVHDWLGGYPYESATPEEVETRLGAMGFEMTSSFPLAKGLGIFGTGCAEYVLARRPAARA